MQAFDKWGWMEGLLTYCADDFHSLSGSAHYATRVGRHPNQKTILKPEVPTKGCTTYRVPNRKVGEVYGNGNKRGCNRWELRAQSKTWSAHLASSND